jgi:hypothetical protein
MKKKKTEPSHKKEMLQAQPGEERMNSLKEGAV